MHIGSYRAIRTSGRWSYCYNLKLVCSLKTNHDGLSPALKLADQTNLHEVYSKSKLDGVSGFEPENADIKDRCRNHLAIPQKMAMGWRFELQCGGLTVRCFTELAIPSH